MGDNASGSDLFFGLYLEKLEVLAKISTIALSIHTPLKKSTTKCFSSAPV